MGCYGAVTCGGIILLKFTMEDGQDRPRGTHSGSSLACLQQSSTCGLPSSIRSKCQRISLE